MQPLNRYLHRRLVAVFQHVDISNEGEQSQITHAPDWLRGGRLRAQVGGGEYYRVNCPYCGDTRKRLYIHHQWGEYDARTSHRILHPVICYNEHCIDSWDRQRQLYDFVYPLGPTAYAISQPRPPAEVMAQTPARLPQNCVSINRPAQNCDVPDEQLAAAQAYLTSRGFDLAELQTRWNVKYTERSCFPPPKIFDRIVIPVRSIRTRLGQTEPQNYLAGWQAREIRPSLRPALFPKYMNSQNFKKSHVLYGLPAALDTPGPIVVVEGVTDVWRLGTNAVALFGKSLSETQRGLLLKHFASRALVIFLDTDAISEAARMRNALREGRRERGDKAPIVTASLPVGRADIAECHREEAWDCVAHALGSEIPSLE